MVPECLDICQYLVNNVYQLGSQSRVESRTDLL